MSETQPSLVERLLVDLPEFTSLTDLPAIFDLWRAERAEAATELKRLEPLANLTTVEVKGIIARFTALEAIVAKLPVDAEGNAVVPGDRKWVQAVPVSSGIVLRVRALSFEIKRESGIAWYTSGTTHSTRAAAESAARGDGGGR